MRMKRGGLLRKGNREHKERVASDEGVPLGISRGQGFQGSLRVFYSHDVGC